MFRLIIWLLELGALAMLSTAVIAWAFGRSRSVAGFLRAAATLVIAGAISGGFGLSVGIVGALGSAADPVSDGLIGMMLSLPATVWALDRVGRTRGRAGGRGMSLPRSNTAAPARNRQESERIDVAWRRATRMAPLQRLRIASARDACGYVLGWAETHPLDMEAVECAVLIRKRLPELVDQTERYCTLADRAERRAAIDGMVGDLASLGRMALRRVETSKVELGDSLAATRAHIASRTNETATF
jgi:hypothetical protein